MPLNKLIRSFDECVLGNYSECVDALGDEPEEGYFHIIPFYCGQDPICRTDSDLVRAVQNVKDEYAVVGVAEHYSEFIEVLEYVLPDYFRGMSKVYQAMGSNTKQHSNFRFPERPHLQFIRDLNENINSTAS